MSVKKKPKAPTMTKIDKFSVNVPAKVLSRKGPKSIKLGDTTIQYFVNNWSNVCNIHVIRTPVQKRGAGSARKALKAFLALTDAQNLTVRLAALPLDDKTKMDLLIAFYQSFGFVLTGVRLGLNGDVFMVRLPKISGVM